MDKFITVAKVEDVEPGTARFVRVGNLGVSIFNSGGAFYAAQDDCPGDGGFLSQGILRGTEIECPSDHARFYLPTGECMYPATSRPLPTYRVWIDGNEVKIDVGELIKAEMAERGSLVEEIFAKIIFIEEVFADRDNEEIPDIPILELAKSFELKD